jgi:hypothetical protein
MPDHIEPQQVLCQRLNPWLSTHSALCETRPKALSHDVMRSLEMRLNLEVFQHFFDAEYESRTAAPVALQVGAFLKGSRDD